MAYRVEFARDAEREFNNLDNSIKKRIAKFIDSLETKENPKAQGKPLVENLKNLWRYRVGDYRLIAEIQDNRFIILMLCISHRKNAYSIIKKRLS